MMMMVETRTEEMIVVKSWPKPSVDPGVCHDIV